MFYRIIDSIARVCKEYHERIGRLEDEKFDLEYIVKRKDMEVERWAAKDVALFWGTHKTYKDLNFIFKNLTLFCDMSSAVLSLLRQLV